jgi:hypothetical protein
MKRLTRLLSAGLLLASLPGCSDEVRSPVEPGMPDAGSPEAITKIRVTPTSGLVTTEAGESAKFAVSLTAEPTAPVSVLLFSEHPEEGGPDVSELVFTADDWNQPHQVVVTGANDPDKDGNRLYRIVLDPASSEDLRYQGADVPDVTLTNVDDETPSIVLSPAETSMNEGGETTVAVSLSSRPTAAVHVTLASSDAAVLELGTTELTFPVLAWDRPQMVRVTLPEDNIADGGRTPSITARAMSADVSYDGLDAPAAVIATIDNDATGIFRSEPYIYGPLAEDYGSFTFTVSLASQPLGTVFIELQNDRPGDVTVTPSSFVLGAGQLQQRITVSTRSNRVVDGDRAVNLSFRPASSADPAYSGLTLAPIAFSIADNDQAGMYVSQSDFGSRTTCEWSTTYCCKTISVALASQPLYRVNVSVALSDATEATVSPSSFSFYSSDSGSPVLVHVCGVDDHEADGNQPYTLTFTPTSADPLYQALAPVVLDYTTTDDGTHP